jgi:PiT family inorganic phosphate transporter
MNTDGVFALKSVGFSGMREFVRLGLGIVFIMLVMIYAETTIGDVGGRYLLITAAMIGGYMAMNIGANDVANNVGPAVGSKTLTLTGAIVIAAIFEAAGAIIAGGEVTSTIRGGIISPNAIPDIQTFVWVMMAALLAGALWLNIATYQGLPVSTTHSIVGGVLGAGIAAGGWGIADWGKVGTIVASWVISPVMGGVIAALFLYVIKRTITYRQDWVAAARKVVPILIAVMAWAFATYLLLKGLKHLWKLDFLVAAAIGLAVAAAVYFVVKPMIHRAAAGLGDDRAGVNKLFVVPLIAAAAMLSFAHGANDVANAVGPLAAIHDAVISGGLAEKASIPLWIMVVGAIGIALGLALYGPKLIRTVGAEITELDQSRAFCIALAAAITVIVASQLGIPISSTHTAIGAVFGVGILREMIRVNYAKVIGDIRLRHHGEDEAVIEDYLQRFQAASFEQKGEMVKELKKKKKRPANLTLSKQERKKLNRKYRRELVKRSLALKIAAAWVITVPMSALMAAFLFFTIRGMLLP